MKIVFFGDELLTGPPGAGLVDQVAANLRGHHFIVRARFGDTSLNLYRRAERDVLAHRPQAVFLMPGLHDAMSQSEAGLRPWYRWRKGLRGGRLSPLACRENLRALLENFRRHDLRCFVALPPAEYRPQLVDALREVNNATHQLCMEMQVPALDLFEHMTPGDVPQRPPLRFTWLLRAGLRQWRSTQHEHLRRRGGFSYSVDGLQATPAAAERMARHIVLFLRRNGVPG